MIAQTKYQVEDLGFQLPILQHIGRGPDTDVLYDLEGRRTGTILQAAEVMMRLFGFTDRSDLYRKAVPEQLASTLDSFDPRAAEAAAIGFLLKRGYQIGDKPKDTLR